MTAIPLSKDRVPKQAGFFDPKKLPRGPNDLPLCRWCGNECPGKRNTFCGPDCVHEWKLRTQPAYQAEHVLRRDVGICSVCGLDTIAQAKEFHELLSRARKSHAEEDRAAALDAARALGLIGKNYKGSLWGFNEHRRPWDMDHVLPVVEGGGSCGIDNLRTLCIPCHRKVTAELAKRRAAQRRSK